MADIGARSADELHELADLAIDAEAKEPFGVHLFASDDRRAELARHVEQVVFAESFGNTPDLLAAEYGSYEARSIFLCVLDYRRRLPAGMLRIVLPELDGSGLKSLDDIEPIWGVSVDELLRMNDLRMPRASTWDLATLAVDPAYRSPAVMGLVGTALYQALSLLSQRCRVDWAVSIQDERIHRVMKRILRSPLHAFEGIEPLPYLGSPVSIPVWIRQSEWKERLLTTDLTLHGIMFDGDGFEGALHPLDAAIPQQLISWLLAREPATRSDGEGAAAPPATGTS